jgi:TetR/AcrR family transcriptional regulator, transcriptional repressor for nem operon
MSTMRKPSNREKILSEGLRVVHKRGFGAASVRDIVQAAGVPQGSFSNNFVSKEAFGLEIIDRYHDMTSATEVKTLRNDALPPLRRLREWLDAQLLYLKKDDMRNGCMYGNFSAEAGGESEPIRSRVADIFVEIQASVAYCLAAAVKAGELPKSTRVDEMAGFIITSLEGAILVGKVQRSAVPFERFRTILLNGILRRMEAVKPDAARKPKRRRRTV